VISLVAPRLGVILLSALMAAAPAGAAPVEVLEVFKDWSAVQHTDGKTATCFATSRPVDIQPKPDGPVESYVYLSYYPGDKVSPEISFKLRTKPEKGTVLSVLVGTEPWKFVGAEDRAYLENPKSHALLLKAIKKGNTLVIKGTPAKGGAATAETYSLDGVSGAMDRAKAACAG
jgi:hypothetical protein